MQGNTLDRFLELFAQLQLQAQVVPDLDAPVSSASHHLKMFREKNERIIR